MLIAQHPAHPLPWLHGARRQLAPLRLPHGTAPKPHHPTGLLMLLLLLLLQCLPPYILLVHIIVRRQQK